METSENAIVKAEPMAVTIETGGGLQTFTEEDVRRFIVGDKKVSDEAIRQYLLKCKAMGADPLTDVQARVDSTSITPMMTIGAYMRRAARNPRYRGHVAGVVYISPDGVLSYRQGDAIYEGEYLMGGWAEVYMDGYAQPIRNEVSLNECSTGKNTWVSMPGVMVRKVALSRALREACPAELSLAYTVDEMGGEQ